MDSTISMKRIEIVIDAGKLEELVSLLLKAAPKATQCLETRVGLGSRGTRDPE